MTEHKPIPPHERPISIVGDEGPVEPIRLVDGGEKAPSAMRALGDAGQKAQKKRIDFRRPVNLTGAGATRCRLFHSKMAAASLEHMEEQINEWIDGEQVEVKQVGHVIGTLEGKTPEPNLIVLVWY